jgi:hypothetical protein
MHFLCFLQGKLLKKCSGMEVVYVVCWPSATYNHETTLVGLWKAGMVIEVEQEFVLQQQGIFLKINMLSAVDSWK